MSLAERPTLPPPPTARLSPAAAYAAVFQRLEKTRRRILRQTTAAVIVSLAAKALALFAVFVLVDYWFEFALVSRGGALAALLGGCVAAFLYDWQKFVSPYTVDRAAIDVENEIDEFGQGLRTALDYQESADRDFAVRPAAASPGLLSALHHETYSISERAPWDEVAPARWLWQAILGLLLISGAGLIALAINPELRTAAGRMLLLPWQYTQVTFEPQQATVKQGESVLVKATITGRPISSARLRYATTSNAGEWTTIDLLPADTVVSAENESAEQTEQQPQLLHGTVQTKLTNLNEDLTFEVVAGPVKLPLGNIRVLQPLVLKDSHAAIIPPKYTKQPATVVKGLNHKVWEGSHVELKFGLNRAAAAGSLKRIDGPKDKPAVEHPAVIKDKELTFDLENLRESGTYELTAVTSDEVELKPERVKIQVTLDRKPNVKWLVPEEQLEVTPTTEVSMSIAAEDDLGLHKAGIAYQVDNGKLETLWETDAEGAEKSLIAVAALLLEDRGLTHKDSVTYYAFAEDNYFDETRRTTTPLRFIDIRPYQQDFQLVEGGGACKGSSVTLEELIKRQREQLTQSFAAQDQLPLSKNAAKKLATAQTELQDQTIEFAKGLAELGAPVLSLDEASLQMGSAAIALDEGDVAAAVPAQQQALAYLIMARENIRKKLSNSPSASACRKFDKEQKQKLRLPEQKKQEQQQQLSQNKKQLEDLAKRERQWSQQACQACQNPSSSSSSSSNQQQQQQQQNQPQPSKEDVAKAQEQMLKELAELQKQIAENDLAGKTAQEQAARAQEAMEQGQKELQQNKGDAASKQGETAADRLEQLAAHLAAMNQRDFGQRLNQAQKNAAALAAKQEQLAKEVGGQKEGDKPESGGQKPEGDKEGQKPGDAKNGGGEQPSTEQLAGKQGDLAQQAKMLAEVLEKLRQDAKGEKGSAGGKLEQIAAEQKPGDIAAGMERTAGDLKQGNKEQGTAGAEQARNELAQLAQTLGAAKGEFSQPQLQELMKLEEQLAKLREDAKRGEARAAGDEGKKEGDGQKPGEGKKPGEGQQAGAAEKWEQLQERLQQLAESDKRLEEALKKLGGNAQLKPGDKLRPSEFQQNSGNQQTPPGHYSWDQLGDYKGLDEIAKALQTKIQEAILAGALLDADEPVPPEYKGLVEKYYRTLSDDLR